MPLVAEKQMEHIGETCPVADSLHDLIQVFNGRINSLWRYDQYIANAEGKSDLQDFWRNLKKQDQEACDRMKKLLAKELQRETSSKAK
jgi:capsule polysaccharide modification protein KpsS